MTNPKIFNLHEDLLGDINRFHNKFGFKVENIFTGDEETEPHCSLKFRLNNIKVLDTETIELIGYQPVTEIIKLLEELRKSCDKNLLKLKSILSNR